MSEKSLSTSRCEPDYTGLMRTGSQEFVSLVPPFYAESCGAGDDGVTIDYFVQDSKGTTVVEYCRNRAAAEAIAAALNGPSLMQQLAAKLKAPSEKPATVPSNLAEAYMEAAPMVGQPEKRRFSGELENRKLKLLLWDEEEPGCGTHLKEWEILP